MVVLQERSVQYQQRFEAAGVNVLIAQTAADLQAKQDQGIELTQIQQEILEFAQSGAVRQEELLELNAQADALASAQVDKAEAMQSLEAIDQRRTELAAGLFHQGITPQTDASLWNRAETNLRELTVLPEAIGDETLPESNFERMERPGASEAPPKLLEPPELSLERSREQALLENARSLLMAAAEVGLAEREGELVRLRGRRYSITQINNTIIIEGYESGKLLADGDDILKSEGFSKQDYETFERLGEKTAEELRQDAEALQPQAEGLRREYQLQPIRSRNLQL